MRNRIGQELNVGDRVLHVSRSGSHFDFKVGNITGWGARQRYYGTEEVTVLIKYDKAHCGKSRGVGLDKVFKLAP